MYRDPSDLEADYYAEQQEQEPERDPDDPDEDCGAEG